MGQVNQLLSDAIVTWTGRGRTSWPARDEQLVVEEFGTERAAELMPLIRQLVDDFYTSDAVHTVADLKEMGDKAAAQFAARHPEISEAAVDALAWCYTWDYR
jgi:hypothetical protein